MNDKPNDIGTVRHFESGADVARKSADHAGAVLRQAIANRGAAVWVLAGGSSPMAAYHELLDRDRDPIDWSRVTLLVGDERHVPYDSPDSNWGAIS